MLLVVRPGAPSSFLLLVVRPGALSSVLAPIVPSSFLLVVEKFPEGVMKTPATNFSKYLLMRQRLYAEEETPRSMSLEHL